VFFIMAVKACIVTRPDKSFALGVVVVVVAEVAAAAKC
jgi:hypothetical protein